MGKTLSEINFFTDDVGNGLSQLDSWETFYAEKKFQFVNHAGLFVWHFLHVHNNKQIYQ